MRKCKHPNCDGGPCKSLTREELQPTAEDTALATQLVAEGWVQTSSKFRHIRRWAAPGAPRARDMIAPEFRDTAWGRRAIRAIERNVTSSQALHSEFMPYDTTLYSPSGPPRNPDRPYQFADGVEPNPLIEERTITPPQFIAYKAACRRRETIPPVVTETPPTRDPSHWAASELGTWPGQPVRETTPTMLGKYGTVRAPDSSVVLVTNAMSTKDAAEKAYALKGLPGLYTVVNEDGVDQYAHTQPPTELELLFEVAHRSAAVIDEYTETFQNMKPYGLTARWIAAVDALRGMKPPAPVNGSPDTFWRGHKYATDPSKKIAVDTKDGGIKYVSVEAVRRHYPDVELSEALMIEVAQKIASGELTNLASAMQDLSKPSDEQQAEWRKTWGAESVDYYKDSCCPIGDRFAAHTGKRPDEHPGRCAEACPDHWHCDPADAAHKCDVDRVAPCPSCGAKS